VKSRCCIGISVAIEQISAGETDLHPERLLSIASICIPMWADGVAGVQVQMWMGCGWQESKWCPP